ncbi:MAG TPA: hypothetical protein VLX90_19765 [Steroidobacteraceae bacterium]|nr:hypothetical protein [Steroidobacteraceae bacterium]
MLLTAFEEGGKIAWLSSSSRSSTSAAMVTRGSDSYRSCSQKTGSNIQTGTTSCTALCRLCTMTLSPT